MNNMAAYFSRKIMTAHDTKGTVEAQALYRKYFITCKVAYGMFQDDTDAILMSEGYGDCIVTV